MSGPALPTDYDADPERFAVNQAATAAYSTAGDVHAPVARRLAALGVGDVVDVAGGDGTLARELARVGVRSVVVDQARHVTRAPRPAVRADVRSLPFQDDSFDAACCLWALHHLDDPREALREAVRVLRSGGWFVASTSARTNDLEFAEVLPGWAATGSFDAEDAAEIVGSVMADVQVEHWDAPMIELPDRAAVSLFLRGRGLDEGTARALADGFATPMSVTKRGCLVWARADR